MSDMVNILLAKEILGHDPKIFSVRGLNRGFSKQYLMDCFKYPYKLNNAFWWKHTLQGNRYWMECCDQLVPKEEIQKRMSILLPLIYDKTLTLEDLM